MLTYSTGDIDPEAFSGDLPSTEDNEAESEPWTQNLNNLKHVHQNVSAYIVDRCRRQIPLPSGEPDLEAVAQLESEKDISQLLKLVFLCAIFGRFSMDYIQQLTTFSEEAQSQFYLILEEPEPVNGEEDVSSLLAETPQFQEDGKTTSSPEDVIERKLEFVYEERIAVLVATNMGLEREAAGLKEQLESMHDLHTKLQKSYDNLEIQQQDTTERLNALRTGKGEQSILAIQRTKMQQQETVIATLESQIRSLNEENDGLKAQTEVLQTQSEGFQQLQDDVYELKLERDKLQRKANAADKYKEKLQTLQKFEDENETLKYRLTEMQRQLKQSDSEQVTSSDLRRENDEFKQLVSNIEQELRDTIEAKKRAEFEKTALQARLHQADEQATRWHARAEELQGLLNENPALESPTTPRGSTSNDLDLNLAETLAQQEEADYPHSPSSPLPTTDSNTLTPSDLHSLLTIMRSHTSTSTSAQKSTTTTSTSPTTLQRKLASHIESSRLTAKELTQVIDHLSFPRVEFIGVKELDAAEPYGAVPPSIDDLAATYGLASQSARCSVTSLSAAAAVASRRSSLSSVVNGNGSVDGVDKTRKGSVLRSWFGA
jgi:myosin heavy subunit